MQKFKSTLIPVVLILTLFAAGCTTAGDEKESSSTKDKPEVSIGTWKTAQTITPYFYEEFSEGALAAEILPFTNPGDQKTALLAGSLDMCGTTLVSAILAASNDEPIAIVAGLCNKCSAFVVGADSGIESCADLKGKRIAYVPGTMHHILLLEILAQNNLDPEKDVTLKRIDFFDMGTALASGEIDAFCSGEPYPTIAELEGYGKILSYPYYDDSIGSINAAMITTRDNIENNPEMIQALVDSHINATEGLLSDQDKWLDMAESFGTDREILDFATDNMELFYHIDEDFIEHTKKLAKKMLELGMIDEIPNVDTLFDLRFLENAKK